LANLPQEYERPLTMDISAHPAERLVADAIFYLA
jgi:hypothetical protein